MNKDADHGCFHPHKNKERTRENIAAYQDMRTKRIWQLGEKRRSDILKEISTNVRGADETLRELDGTSANSEPTPGYYDSWEAGHGLVKGKQQHEEPRT